MSAGRVEDEGVSGSPGPTIFEVSRRLDELARRLDERERSAADEREGFLARLEAVVVRIEDKYVPRETYLNLVGRVGKLEDRQEWLVRIVGAIIIAAVVGLVVKVNGVGG